MEPVYGNEVPLVEVRIIHGEKVGGVMPEQNRQACCQPRPLPQ